MVKNNFKILQQKLQDLYILPDHFGTMYIRELSKKQKQSSYSTVTNFEQATSAKGNTGIIVNVNLFLLMTWHCQLDLNINSDKNYLITFVTNTILLCMHLCAHWTVSSI